MYNNLVIQTQKISQIKGENEINSSVFRFTECFTCFLVYIKYFLQKIRINYHLQVNEKYIYIIEWKIHNSYTICV